ncbi:MAG: hypothetical protein CV087_20360 [Candidatus Brocadia sp. WS118]|nr:MAG: hypothetical protein CV087_20360 [Candidatus Brocadia sp. WS118]
MFKKKTENVGEFEPSKIILPRILKALLEHSPIGRTMLATIVNTNYPIIASHLVWLEARSYVEFLIENGKLLVKLTENGREFALKIASIPY